MNAKAYSLKYFTENKFKVPFFQRQYVWNADNWNELLKAIDEEDGQMPFIGSFIFQKSLTSSNEFLIIDGQQRITTIFILIKAFLDAFYNKIDSEFFHNIKKIIFYQGQIDYNLAIPNRVRLSLSTFDNISFEKIMNFNIENGIDVNDFFDNKNLLEEAYLYFYDEFKDYDKEKMKKLGLKIYSKENFFIVIEIDKKDNIQKIFDSVNTLGQKLTCADIIKNYLFQKLNEIHYYKNQIDEIIKIYKENWENIFYSKEKSKFWSNDANFGKKVNINVDYFLKYFAIIKQFYSSSMKNNERKISLEDAYKKKIDSIHEYKELLNFIIELKNYANFYYEMCNNFDNLKSFSINDSINTTLLIIKELNYTTFMPIILKYYVEKPNDMNSFMKVLQKFMLGALIYGTKTNNFNNVSESLVKKNNCQECIEYLNDTFEQNMHNSNRSFSEFPNGISYISKKNNNQAKLLLYVIELILRNNDENRYLDIVDISKLSLEHIMPQNFSKWDGVPAYDFDKNGNYVEITDKKNKLALREIKVYSLGNMILLTHSLNSAISNELIEKKFNAIKKYVGAINIANDFIEIYNQNKMWNEININERTKYLFDCLNEYYQFTIYNAINNKPIIYNDDTNINVEYSVNDFKKDKIESNDNLLHKLSDKFNFTFHKPEFYVFFNKKTYTKDGKDLLLKTCYDIYSKVDKSKFENLAKEEFSLSGKVPLLSYDKTKMRKPKEIANTGIYIETNKNLNEIVSNIKKLFDIFEVDYNTYYFCTIKK